MGELHLSSMLLIPQLWYSVLYLIGKTYPIDLPR
jgi:hypothetical protein